MKDDTMKNDTFRHQAEWRPATSTAQTPCPGCGAWKDFHADGEHDGNCPA